MKPLISVIIPTYNRAELLKQSIESLNEQTFKEWECIIVDDGSDFDQLSLIRDFVRDKEKIKLINRPEINLKGPSACRNFGMKKARGEFIQFFDDDDLMYPSMLRTKYEAIKKSTADVVVSPLDHFYIKRGEVLKQNEIYSETLIKDYVIGNVTWYSSGPLWRRSFIKEGFDESIQTLDDYDFNLRHIYNNPKVEYHFEPLQRYNKYKVGETLSSKSRLGNERQIISGYSAYKKHYFILKDKGLLNTEIKEWLGNRFIYILRASLVNKYFVSTDIFKFLVGNRSLLSTEKLMKVLAGFISFKFFNKGYILLSDE